MAERAQRRGRRWAMALCAVLALVYLLAAPMGTDLSAAVAHGDFFAAHGFRPVDFRWYGGTSPLGYSLLSPPVIAVLGARLTGLAGSILAAVAFADLAGRSARRPRLVAVIGTLCIFGNLVSGRISYALGLGLGLAGLAWLAQRPRAAGALLLLAATASPVAGLFLLLAAAACAIGEQSSSAVRIGAPAAIGLLLGLPFAESGANTMSRSDTVHSLVLCAAVLVLVRPRLLRAGAVVTAVAVLGAYLVATPVGLAVTRLPVMFALPLLVGFARLPLALLGIPLLLLADYAPPVITADWRDRGSPAASRAYFGPLLRELDRLHPSGRLEVPPLRDYWESVYLAEHTPLARGWLRQADTLRNPLFFHGRLTADGYLGWLHDNAVQYVAVADAAPSHVARAEAALLRGQPQLLAEVWRGRHWRLFAVPDPVPVALPATVRRLDATGVSLDTAGAGPVLVRVRWSRWLTLSGPGCLAPSGRWTQLRADRAGSFRISSDLHLRQTARCR